MAIQPENHQPLLLNPCIEILHPCLAPLSALSMLLQQHIHRLHCKAGCSPACLLERCGALYITQSSLLQAADAIKSSHQTFQQ